MSDTASPAPTNGNGSSIPTNGNGHRHDDGKFVKGYKPACVSTGRPKGSISWKRELELAVREVEKTHKRSFMQHAVARAYESDKVLPHVLDRLVPKSDEKLVSDRPILILTGNSNQIVSTPHITLNGVPVAR